MSRVIHKPRVIDMSNENNGLGDGYNLGHTIASTASTVGGVLGAFAPFNPVAGLVGAGLGIFGSVVGGLTEAFHEPAPARHPYSLTPDQQAVQTRLSDPNRPKSFRQLDREDMAAHKAPINFTPEEQAQVSAALNHTGGFNTPEKLAAKAVEDKAAAEKTAIELEKVAGAKRLGDAQAFAQVYSDAQHLLNPPQPTAATAPVRATEYYDRPAEYAHPTYQPSQSYQSSTRAKLAEPSARHVGKKIKPGKKKVIKLKNKK